MVLGIRAPTEWQDSEEVAEEAGAYWVPGGQS